MALKDRVLTLADLNGIDVDADPLLYVPANWSGVITDIYNVAGVSLAGQLYVMGQFLNEVYVRRWALNVLMQASIDLNQAAKPFFIAKFTAYLAALTDIGSNDYTTMAALEQEVLAEVQAAGEANDGTADPDDYFRLLWAFRWACAIDNEPFFHAWQTIRDVVNLYDPRQDGWNKCKTKLTEIINIHP